MEKEKDTRPLFQITEAAHACGLSRSTLLRMEEKGLLAPAYIAPDSGRRYYDNHNVARVLQIEKFKAMGLGTEEIAGYFASGGEVTHLLSMLEERLRELSRGVEELRLRAGGSGGLSIQLMTLPAVTVALILHASDRRSLVQPRSLRAVLIRFPSSFLSMVSPPIVCYQHLFCMLIAYILVDAKNSGC